eukprot:TRINITY_DN18240_c0_g1_i2.p1 TRINITY_DN18240_c0_g1~~TRINITY_DN18240_c0_g1_i2.p1  ORF type:complete len:659 (+),score=120.51 TRINITY_DN18240_c0_g1_i2:163-2139(+)
MPRSKGKAQKGSALKLGGGLAKQVKPQDGQTMDFRTAAAMPEFTAIDPLAHAGGKRVATNTGMKTTFASESSLNVARRINNASIPLGQDVEDDAAVTEELSLAKFDTSREARRFMPRRPDWSFEISSGRLHHRETEMFKNWMADVQKSILDRGGYPPAYETNLQVWRQLWRVLERCHVAVVVLDARHPLLHLPPALVHHVRRTLKKPLVLVLNKLDAVEPATAAQWAAALQAGVPGVNGVVGHSKEDVHQAAFRPLTMGRDALIELCHKVHLEHTAEMEAAAAQKQQPTPAPVPMPEGTCDDMQDFMPAATFAGARSGYVFRVGDEGLGYYKDQVQRSRKSEVPKTRNATAAAAVPNSASAGDGILVPDGSIMLGLVGHPNVGKSSLINSIMGEKVVSVKATPGHTKTLQTLRLDEKTCLCDSPGVVFPRLEVSREAQIIGMLVPLAQVREPFSAIRWVMEHATKPLPELLGLKAVNMKRVRELHECGVDCLRLDLIEAEAESDLVPWSAMLLCAQLASQRGFMQGGRPDVMKAGTEILERVLQGRVPYSVLPPSEKDLPSRPAPTSAADASEESDWQACDDEGFESEESEDSVGDKDLLELFGKEAKGPGRGSISSTRRFRRKQKAAELAGEADPARTLRDYAGRLKEIEQGYPGKE